MPSWIGKEEKLFTFRALNWMLFGIGISIVWLSSHSWIALLGAWVASMHFTLKIEED